MKYGAMNFPVIPVLDEIDVIAALDFDYIELAMDPPMAHHSILRSNKEQIKNTLEDYGMGLVCHLPTFLSTADLTESIRKASVAEMLRSLDLAADLGAMKVVLHPSSVTGMGGFVIEEVKRYSYDFLRVMTSAAKSAGLVICIENMFPRNILGVEPEDFVDMFATFPSLLLTLDTGHANIDDLRGKRLALLTERFGSRIGHLHFSDNRGVRDEHRAIGKGNINFKKLIRKLKAQGYDDTLTLEVFDNDRRKLVASRRRVENLFAGS